MLLFAASTVVGLGLLTRASDHFVVGSARLAVRLRVSAVVIGALVIGFGTSLPELLVSGLAAGQGSLDIAVGNVVGSNIANLTLVLGVAALLLPPAISSQTLRREAPIATVAVIAFALVLRGELERWEGAVLIGGLVISVAWIIRTARSDDDPLASEVDEFIAPDQTYRLGVESLRTALGMAGTLAGAQLLVYGAQGIAAEAGLDEGFVGLTLVALGTSLPELVTAVQAARRGEADLIVGNLLGSNMFNSFAVAGVAASVGPGSVDPDLAGLATIVMVSVAVATWLFMSTGRRVTRWEAALLLCAYPVVIVTGL